MLRLPHRIGTAKASEMMFSCRSYQVNKRALIEIDGLSLHDAHALDLFKNEGLARLNRRGRARTSDRSP
jgi:hypothetical protein